MTHSHGPNVSEVAFCPVCIRVRVDPILNLHAGHKAWGGNDGSVRGVLEGWGLRPYDFLESLTAWGYTITVAAPPSEKSA
jgi:hypothetical protein